MRLASCYRADGRSRVSSYVQAGGAAVGALAAICRSVGAVDKSCHTPVYVTQAPPQATMQRAQVDLPKEDLPRAFLLCPALPSPLSKGHHGHGSGHGHLALGQCQCCLVALVRPLQQRLCPLRLLPLGQGRLQPLLLLAQRLLLLWQGHLQSLLLPVLRLLPLVEGVMQPLLLLAQRLLRSLLLGQSLPPAGADAEADLHVAMVSAEHPQQRLHAHSISWAKR